MKCPFGDDDWLLFLSNVLFWTAVVAGVALVVGLIICGL